MCKRRFVVLVVIALLLSTLAIPCYSMDMKERVFKDFSEYEKYVEANGRENVPINFVDFDMISILGDFSSAVLPWNNPSSMRYYYHYTFNNSDGMQLFIRTYRESLFETFDKITDEMKDMRRLERVGTNVSRQTIRHCGLVYTYYHGVLAYLDWEYGGVYFTFQFDNGNQMDMSHPIIGKLLSRNKKDVKEGLKLLKAHMHKNGFVNEPLIFRSAVALVVVAGLAVFLILRAHRTKRKSVSTSTVPVALDSPTPDTPQ